MRTVPNKISWSFIYDIFSPRFIKYCFGSQKKLVKLAASSRNQRSLRIILMAIMEYLYKYLDVVIVINVIRPETHTLQEEWDV